MVHQAPLNAEDEATLHAGLRAEMAGLAHDVLTLAELQVQLLGVDLRDARRGAGSALAQLALGSIVVLGSVPVLLLAAAHALVAQLHWSLAMALSVAGLTAALIASVLIWTGCMRLMRALGTVQRSRAELVETLRWLKGSLRQQAAPPSSYARSTTTSDRLSGLST